VLSSNQLLTYVRPNTNQKHIVRAMNMRSAAACPQIYRLYLNIAVLVIVDSFCERMRGLRLSVMAADQSSVLAGQCRSNVMGGS
jgi:hypothetical protein